MRSGRSKLEVVKLAREQLGDVPSPQIAAHIEATFGLEIQPAIVTVLLASLREREHLEASRRRVQEEMGRIRAEQASAGSSGKKPQERTPRRQTR
jgi:hypothetical protein